MVGAIDLLRKWRDECNKHTYEGKNGEEVKVYSHCCRCKLQGLCNHKRPRERTDKDINTIVKLLVENENEWVYREAKRKRVRCN